MTTRRRRPTLAEMHTPEAIKERLEKGDRADRYLRDFVFGAIDGTVTTFAVVSGVEGAALSPNVALVLGVANLLADGFSMAAGNFLATRTESQVVDRTRRMEEHHIETIPEAEREEIRQIYANKGFDGELLGRIVDVITEDRTRWINTMLMEEHGLTLSQSSPLRAALATFVAFCLAGAVPLLPFLVFSQDEAPRFSTSAVATALTFLAVGWLKGRALHRSRWTSALETLALGALAATFAYVVGAAFKYG